MRKFFKFLQFVFLLPILPILGVDGAGAGSGSSTGDNNTDGGEEGKGSPEGDKGTTGDKPQDKSFTQADVDKLIKDRLSRESKKYDKMIADIKKTVIGDSGEGQGGDGQGTEGDKGINPATLAAQQALQTANKRLIDATAQAEAMKLGVDPKYVADAVKLADLAKIEVGDDGAIDSAAIAKALDAVLKRMPALKSQAPEGGSGFKVGGQGSNNTQGWKSTQTQQQGTTRKSWNRNQ